MRNPPRKPRAALLHTATSVVADLHRLWNTLLPELEPFHLLDPALLADARKHGLTEELTDRVVQLAELAAELDMKAVLVTCSSIGPCADAARERLPIPVFRIDVPMARRAVRDAARIVLAATVESPVAPSTELLTREAAAAGREVTVRHLVCGKAAAAWARGETDEGDAVFLDCFAEFAGWADAIVLAQASMAPAGERLKARLDVPVLVSPRSGILQVRAVLASALR